MEWKVASNGMRFQIQRLLNGKNLLSTIDEITKKEADVIIREEEMRSRKDIEEWHTEEGIGGNL